MFRPKRRTTFLLASIVALILGNFLIPRTVAPDGSTSIEFPPTGCYVQTDKTRNLPKCEPLRTLLERKGVLSEIMPLLPCLDLETNVMAHLEATRVPGDLHIVVPGEQANLTIQKKTKLLRAFGRRDASETEANAAAEGPAVSEYEAKKIALEFLDLFGVASYLRAEGVDPEFESIRSEYLSISVRKWRFYCWPSYRGFRGATLISLDIDADSGKLVSFFRTPLWIPDGADPQITQEDATVLAREFLADKFRDATIDTEWTEDFIFGSDICEVSNSGWGCRQNTSRPLLCWRVLCRVRKGEEGADSVAHIVLVSAETGKILRSALARK